MKLLSVLSGGRYVVIALVATIAMLVAFPLFQSFGNPQIWFTFIKPLNFALYLLFSTLFGITAAVQYHAYKEKQNSCTIKGASANAGSILGIFAFQCSACVPVLAQIFGLGTVTFLSVYKTQLIIIGMIFMIVSLYLLGAFKKE